MCEGMYGLMGTAGMINVNMYRNGAKRSKMRMQEDFAGESQATRPGSLHTTNTIGAVLLPSNLPPLSVLKSLPDRDHGNPFGTV